MTEVVNQINPQLEESWKVMLEAEFNTPYFLALKQFLLEEKAKGMRVYPPGYQIFSAFNFTPVQQVKVVLIGQDPYHGDGQAHGLSFSVPQGVKPPPSLVNIFKEIQNDLGINNFGDGNLESWAKQGVLLLNATLTVRANEAGSHQNRGWENFTDAAIKALSAHREGLVFLLWGKYAQAKETLIDNSKHYILKAPHPSPFSAHTGFLGCKHFSQANAILAKQGITPINWQL